MKYSVHQPWDPLKVCVVGRSYSPEFYSFITDNSVKTILEKVAKETEEDYQKLITLLESFGVNVLRPTLSDNYNDYLTSGGKISPPPMCPRDYLTMIGEYCYVETNQILVSWDYIKGDSWPTKPKKVNDIPAYIVDECRDRFNLDDLHDRTTEYGSILSQLGNSNFIIQNIDKHINSAMISRVGKDLYFGTELLTDDVVQLQKKYANLFPNYRCHVINTGGHADGTFCIVKPGLIITTQEIDQYSKLFPNWEIIQTSTPSLENIAPFLELKEKNQGKWWIPGEEFNIEFTNFVNTILDNWVGYVEETVFDVNMLVIDEQNVVCSGYNEVIFSAFDRHGITPHIINFRHRYFWDSGLHCITTDLDRSGQIRDYFK
jgi:hypothetical protein